MSLDLAEWLVADILHKSAGLIGDKARAAGLPEGEGPVARHWPMQRGDSPRHRDPAVDDGLRAFDALLDESAEILIGPPVGIQACGP